MNTSSPFSKIYSPITNKCVLGGVKPLFLSLTLTLTPLRF